MSRYPTPSKTTTSKTKKAYSSKKIRINASLRRDWRKSGQSYRMTSQLKVLMPDEMKDAIRLAAEILTSREKQRVSMNEVVRRLSAAGGLL